jgi:hypothetical protein
MPITLFYPNSQNNMGRAIIILKRTRCYIDCEIYNYEYEDGGCVFGSQININQKKYRVAYRNTEGEGIYVKKIRTYEWFQFSNGKTLEQALEYHKGVDASI